VKPSQLRAGAVIGVGFHKEKHVVEATVAYTAPARMGNIEMILIFTPEFDYPFAIDADREIQIRNG
jgi:hypothetical protein